VPPFEVTIDAARGIVLARAYGVVGQAEAVRMVTEARSAAAASGRNILYDMREARPGDMSSGALFWMPRQVKVLQEPGAGRVRVALLHSPEFAAMAGYWEDTFRNAGLKARGFVTDEAAAVAWLNEA
jgi:hypothetical protein